MNTIEKAIEIAARTHAGQVDKDMYSTRCG